MLLQVQRGADRFTAPREVRRRRAADDLRPAEPFRHHALRADVPDADREVETLLDQVDDSIGEIEVEQQVRMERAELRECRREVPHPEADAAGQSQRALGFRCSNAHRGLGILEVRQQLHAVLVERLPGFRQRQASRRAVQQPHVQVRFEFRDLPRDGRSGQAEPLRRPRKTAQFDDFGEGTDGQEAIHGSIVAFFATINPLGSSLSLRR